MKPGQGGVKWNQGKLKISSLKQSNLTQPLYRLVVTLAIAIGAIGLSLVCQVAGRGKWGNFIAQWVPTWLIIGLYNKLVKLEGHD